jgi:hypothetical protein
MTNAAGLSPADHAKIDQALRTPRPCLLCGQPPAIAGLFWPDRPALWGGKPGKGRLIAYWLCTQCRALPALTQRVEARLAQHIVGRRN